MYMVFKRLIIGGEIVEEEVKMEKPQQKPQPPPPPPPAAAAMVARCECCGLTEECTEAYIKRVRDRYSGRWICGLCAEAVKDEMVRSERRIGSEEALNRHMSFCKNFKKMGPPKNPTEELISAVKQLLLRSLDSPRSGPVKKPDLLRSQSCQPALQSGRLKSTNSL